MPLPTETAKSLREQLEPLRKEIRTLADKSNDSAQTWSAEDQQRWDKVNAEYDAIKLRAQRLERAEELETAAAERANPQTPPGREDADPTARRRSRRSRRADPQATEEDKALALQGWLRHKSGLELRKRHVRACEKLRVRPGSKYYEERLSKDYRSLRQQLRAAVHLRQAEQRAQSVNVPTAGGYTIPQGFVVNLEIALLQYANVRMWCDVMRTDSGNDLPWPTVNDTTNKGSILAENTQVSEVDETFGQLVFHAFKYTSNLVLVPAELIEDSAFNLAAVLGELLGIRFGRIQADHFTFGTGVGQPAGYVTAATLGVTTASPTAIAADEIYDLKHSVDPAYRPGSMFTFHDTIYKAIKKLKDGFGRYLWQSSLAAEAPDTLDGDPIGINQSMASAISAANITMAYGQMSKYKVRDVAGIRMRRLVERYADFDQEGFVGFLRCDANLLDAGTHPVKYLQQHA